MSLDSVSTSTRAAVTYSVVTIIVFILVLILGTLVVLLWCWRRRCSPSKKEKHVITPTDLVYSNEDKPKEMQVEVMEITFEPNEDERKDAEEQV